VTDVPEQPITLGKRSAFEAATRGTPKRYADWCKKYERLGAGSCLAKVHSRMLA
jgi:hypothetical protein